jgi:competence protein ComEA
VAQTSFRQLAIYAVILAMVVVAGSRWLGRDTPTPERAAADAGSIAIEQGETGRVTVHVAGAVRRPGVYRLPARARIHEAVRRAGGPTRVADLTQVNLAAKLQDGRQVLVPERPPAGSPATSAAAVPPAPGVPLNLNTATLEQLDALDGIGPATAQQILDYRQANSGFGSVEELSEVPGIGEKRLSMLREQVRV